MRKTVDTISIVAGVVTIIVFIIEYLLPFGNHVESTGVLTWKILGEFIISPLGFIFYSAVAVLIYRRLVEPRRQLDIAVLVASLFAAAGIYITIQNMVRGAL